MPILQTHSRPRSAPAAALVRAWSRCTPWRLTAIVLVIDLVWILLGGWTAQWQGVRIILIVTLGLLAPLAIPRYRREPRVFDALHATIQLVVFMAAASALSYLIVSTNAPLLDAPLAKLDRTLGFDWLALHAWLRRHRTIEEILRLAYQSGIFQLAFVALFLGIAGRPAALKTFIRLYFIAILVTILLSGLFPAAGAWKFYGVTDGPFDLSTQSHFEPLRDGRLRHIPLGHMQGLVAIPSLHAAMAALLAHAMRGTGVMFAVFVVLNGAMLASTPIIGGHFMVDVLAGLAMAFGLIAMDRRLTARTQAPLNAASIRNLTAVQR